MKWKTAIAIVLLPVPYFVIQACGTDEVSPGADAGPDAVVNDGAASDSPTSQDGTTQDGSTPSDGGLEKCTKCTVTPCGCDVVNTYNFACSLMNDGAVYCWGIRSGASADGGLHQPSSGAVEKMTGIPPMRAIFSGQGNVCAITKANDVWCWGYDGHKQLGYDPGFSEDLFDPRPLPGATNVAQVSMGLDELCVRHFDGTVECMGVGSYGSLGIGRPDGGPPPVEQRTLSPMLIVADGGADGGTLVPVTGVDEVQTSFFSTCVRKGGGVLCTGDNAFYGNLGNPAAPSVQYALDPAFPVLNLTGVTALGRATTWHACAVGGNGSAWCWGKNHELDTAPADSGTSVRTPYEWASLPKMVRVSAGYAATCAIDVSGGVWCWGRNSGMTNGKTDTNDRTPGKVALSAPAVAVTIEGVADPPYACAVLDTGEVDCWGDNSYFHLGRGNIAATAVPGPVKF